MTDEAPTAAEVQALIARLRDRATSPQMVEHAMMREAAAALAAQAQRIEELTAELEGCEIAHRAAGNDALRLTRERNEARRVAEAALAEAEKAEAALAERDKDAERYRYLRDHCFDSFHNNQYPGYNFQCTVMLKPDSGTPTLNAAIDAAIRASAKD